MSALCPEDGFCSRTAYFNGCRGDSCRQFERESRAKYRARHQLPGRPYRAIPGVRFDTSDAACRGQETRIFFLEFDPTAVAKAKAFCRVCPHLDECRAHALEHEEPGGIWGGLTTEERRRTRRQL